MEAAMTQDIRIGVIGLGPHFRETLLPALIGQEGIILSAFCDCTEYARSWIGKRFPGSYVTDSLSNIDFWTSIDCVVCCSSPQVHELVLGISYDREVHCFCEKPAAVSSENLLQIMKKEKFCRKNCVRKVGHTFRYMGGARQFLEIASHHDLTCLEVTYLGSGPNGRRWGMEPRPSFSLTHLTHALDFVTAAAGKISSVTNVRWSAQGDTDTVAVTLVTERCPIVNLFATNAAPAFTCKASAVVGGSGLLQLESLRSVTLTGKVSSEKRSGQIWKERDLGTHVQNDGYMDELRDFFAEVRGESTCLLPDLAYAQHVLEIIEQIEN